MSEPMLLICAWCSKVIRPGKLPASHGVCPECAERLRKQMEAES